MTRGNASSTELAVAYRACARIAATHGRTYFLATRLLSSERRPAVHALYAFARTVDDIVDHGGDHDPATELELIDKQVRIALEPTASYARSVPTAAMPRTGTAPSEATAVTSAATPPATASTVTATPSAAATDTATTFATTTAPGEHPANPRGMVLRALADTIQRYDIAAQHFWTFLHAMRMDVPGTVEFRDRYATMEELREYTSGSAAAIGLQLLPVLGTVVPVAQAEPAAAALGEAFQLTNFLRDVAEDLDRGRIYLPADDLAAFGVHDDLLAHCRRTGHTDPRVRRALAHLIAVNRDIYRRATPGIELLDPRVRPAIRTATALYAAILTRIEDTDYAVFRRRAVVPAGRRLRTAAHHLLRPHVPAF